MGSMQTLPISVLDLAMVASNQTTGEALQETTAFAQLAEELGLKRFWVAEHHNSESVASTSPPVLIAHLAAQTSTIRVGSGGVMLPNHAPLAVAEQFALLEALHPGRIDLGIGRAPGTNLPTAIALRGTNQEAAEDFPRNLLDVMGLLGDPRTKDGMWRQFKATPLLHTTPAFVLLGSSGFSAQLSGVLGLPFAFAHHFDMGGTVEAVGIYRENFEPSAELAEPYVIVTATAIAADSTGEAERLAWPARLRRYGMRSGQMIPVMSPEDAKQHPDFDLAMAADTNAALGTADEVCAQLLDLVARTDASELMLYMPTHELDQRCDSLRSVARKLAPS